MNKDMQLNVQVETELKQKVAKKAIDWLLGIGKFTRILILIGIYVVENLGFAETKLIVQKYHSLACIRAGINDLSHRGFDFSKPRTGEQLLRDVESFLESSE